MAPFGRQCTRILDLAQVFALVRRTVAGRLSFGLDGGVLAFEDGSVSHASAGELSAFVGTTYRYELGELGKVCRMEVSPHV